MTWPGGIALNGRSNFGGFKGKLTYIRRPGALSAVIAATRYVGLREPRRALYIRFSLFPDVR